MDLRILVSKATKRTPSVTDQTKWDREEITEDRPDDDRQCQYDVRNCPAVREAASGHQVFRDAAIIQTLMPAASFHYWRTMYRMIGPTSKGAVLIANIITHILMSGATI